MIQTQHIPNFQTHTGYHCHLTVTYQLFGQVLGSTPVILVNHALTGNSQVTGEHGWWNNLIGPEKAIDTNCFTILAIDIPGNGFDDIPQNRIGQYKQFNLHDIARVQLTVLDALNIDTLLAVVGGSLGGQLAWELAVTAPEKVENLIPIASDWKATDWIIAQCKIQDSILNYSLRPIEDARMHAMTFYRTAASFKQKFKRQKTESQEQYQIESWLEYHGKRLKERFSLATYKLMNHLLGTADATAGVNTPEHVLKSIKAKVHQVSIDTDGLFLADEIYATHLLLQELGVDAQYHEIQSIHGHDAFLIEYDQLNAIVKPIFENALCHQL